MPVCMDIDDRGALNKGKAHWIAPQSQAVSAELLHAALTQSLDKET